MSKTYVGIKLQDLGLYNTLDPKDKIVIVKDKDEGVLQLKDFFLYVQSNLDLSNYYTSTQADTIFMAKVDAYTKKDADVKFALVEKTYTRLQSDSRFALAADTFNKAEIEGKYASKEQMYTKDLVYTKEEAITAFALKTEIPILPDLTPYSTTAKGDLRWALKVDVFSKTEADARFANINNYYTKTESDNKYALLSNTYTKAETDNKFLDTTEAYTKDYINLNIYTKTQVYTKAETDGKYPLKTDVYTVTAVNDQFAAKSWVYSRAEADNTFRKLADSYNRAEVNALIDASKSGLSTDVSNTYYTKTDTDAKFELKGTAYNKIDSDAKYALISNSISPSQVATKYYNKTEVDKAFGDSATNTSNLFALKTAAVGGISLTPSNLTFTKVDGTSNLVTIPTWNQSTTGNAATATKLATPRAIAISGAVTATGVNFDGSSNIDITATSLDATKLTGIVPNANLNGLYSNIDILLNNNRTIYTANSDAGITVYGLADFQFSGSLTGCVVFKTTIPSNSKTMFQLHISGMLYGEGVLDTIVKTYQYNGNLKYNGARVSRGTVDVLVRFGATPDGYICVIIGDVDKSWYFPHISITHGVLSCGVASNPGYVKGWTSYNTNDLTGYTMVTTPYANEVSVTNVAWGNVQNKPTTVSGYGITDAYTKADLYTKIESDNRFSFKQESIKSATLTTSTLAFTKADNTVSNISIPTWNQSTTGNAATATKLATPRTINGVAFDGSGSITTPAYTSLYSLEHRGIKPYQVTTAAMSTYFVDRGRMEIGVDTYNYNDLVVFNSWMDPSGGRLNALLFGKTASQGIWHYSTAPDSTTWGTAKQIAYTDSDITGNAATASKWQTARTFNITGDATWAAVVDGSSDVTGSLTLVNTGVNPGTYTKVTVDGKGRTTAASNLVPADIPNLDMTKVNTGVLGISQGGTGATTAATARTNLGLGTSAVLNVGAVNGVASLDASGKVPTGQLYINNTLTSTDTTVPLTAAQGKVLNDNIGVTNTNLQTLTNRLDTNYYLKSDVFTKTEITNSYFDKTYVNNNFLAQAANKDVSIAGFINASKDILFPTSLTGIKWNMNTDNASIVFKNNGDDDTDSYLGFDVGDNGDEYFRWSFTASSSNKIAMSLKRDKLEINNNVATLGLSTSATLTDISKIPQYGIYSKGTILTDSQFVTTANVAYDTIAQLGSGTNAPLYVKNIPVDTTVPKYVPLIHGSITSNGWNYTTHQSFGMYRHQGTWDNSGFYMAMGSDDRAPTVAFRFKLDGTLDFTGGSVNLVGNTSSATKLQTARTISLTGDGSWSTTFDGTGNSTGTFALANSGVTAGTYTKVTVDAKGRVTSGTGLAAGDIPNLDMTKVNTGVLGINQGGTGATTAATARTNLGLGSAAVHNAGLAPGQVLRLGDAAYLSNPFNSTADGDKYAGSLASDMNTWTPASWTNTGSVNWATGFAKRYKWDTTTEYSVGFGLGLFDGYMYRLYGKRDLSTNKWTQYTAMLLDTFNSSSANIQFNTVNIVSPATTTALPNTFIEPTTGEIKKSSYSFGSAASQNTGLNAGQIMTVGSFGIGSNTALVFSETNSSALAANFGGKTQTFKNNSATAATIHYGAGWYVNAADVAFGLTAGPRGQGIKIFAHDDGNFTNPVIYTVYNNVTMPNEDVTVKSITIKNLSGPTDAAPNLYWGSDGKIYNSSEPALLKSRADNYYLPITRSWLTALDTRSLGTLVPSKIPNKSGGFFFADGTASGFNLGYTDVIWLSTYQDNSAGGVNALVLGKDPNNPILKHATGPFNGTGWTNVKTVAYTDSNITGNAATATKLQTARTINGVAFDGTANITVTDNTKLPTTGGALTNNVVFTNTNTGINWDMNTDYARIYFKNDGDGDSDSYLMFSVGDNGDEYFRWGNSQNSFLMSLKQGNLWVKDTLTTNDIVATNNITANKSLYGNLTLSDGNSVIRDVGNTGSVYYAVVNGGYTGDKEGYMVIQTNLSKNNNGMYGIDIDVYQSYDGVGGKIYIQFYRYGGWYGAYYTMEGNMDFPVRLGVINDKIAIILGTAYWANAQIAVSKVTAHYLYNEAHMRGWTVSLITDISGYSETGPITHATNVIKADWNRLSNKPTTVAGYGITDVYTKSQTYTQTDCDYLYFRKSQTWNRDDMDYRFINADGDTLRGNLHFYGVGWNNVGDDAAFGDFDRAGCLCIKAQNTTTKAGIAFFDNTGTELTKLWSRTSDIYIEKGLVVENIVYAKGFNSLDVRALPASSTAISAMQSYFTTYGGLANASAGGAYGDFLSINTYKDASGGKQNGLFFDKSDVRIYHFQTTFNNAGGWGAGRKLAYLDETITTTGGTVYSGMVNFAVNNTDKGNSYLSITGSGIQSIATIRIAANNDNAGDEPVIITSARGHYPSWVEGLSVFPNKINFFGGSNWVDSSSNMSIGGNITATNNIIANGWLYGTGIGVSNTDSNSGQGISLYGGATNGQPNYGLMFAGTGTFGGHGDVQADWATYFTMTGGSQRGWVFRSLDNGNIASISARGHGYFNYVYSYGDVTAFSDRRLKENIESITNALSKVKELNGVTYTRNDLDDKERTHIGLIAQDVQTVFPEAVRENSDGYLTLNYMGLVGGLVEAIKELDSKNQTLEARLAKLEELINGITE